MDAVFTLFDRSALTVSSRRTDANKASPGDSVNSVVARSAAAERATSQLVER